MYIEINYFFLYKVSTDDLFSSLLQQSTIGILLWNVSVLTDQ